MGCAGPGGGQGGRLVGVPGLDTPWHVVGSNERLVLGLPGELPGNRIACHHLAVGGLGSSPPPFGLPTLALDHGQARTSRLSAPLPAPLVNPAPSTRSPPPPPPP